MISSLQKHSPDAQVVVFCMDETTENALKRMKLSQVTTVGLHEFEDPALLKVKPDRTIGEYCWTCTPSICLYTLRNLMFQSCTYLDADLYFFSSPAPLFARYTQFDIWITSHRYTPRYDQSATSGIYCVQFMHFKNNEHGLGALQWWREACLDWCYARHEDGKFGDQKYLDDWLVRFENVIALPEIGVGVAPWNAQRYHYMIQNELLLISEGHGAETPLVFYHFHALQTFANDYVDLGVYDIPRSVRERIYRPYVRALAEAEEKSLMIGLSDNRPRAMTWKRILKRALTGKLNYYHREKV